MRDYKLINGDITTANEDLICHQVNCQGVMGSGVALAIKDKFPKVAEEYLLKCIGTIDRAKLLGQVQYVGLDKTTVVNMFTQYEYGYNKKYTNTDAFKKALLNINEQAKNKTVAFPWLIGCVRGGGVWDEILPLICETLTDVKEIVFYKL